MGSGLTDEEIDAVRHYGAALVAYTEERAKVDALTGRGLDAITELYPAVQRRDAAAFIFRQARDQLDALMHKRFGC